MHKLASDIGIARCTLLRIEALRHGQGKGAPPERFPAHAGPKAEAQEELHVRVVERGQAQAMMGAHVLQVIPLEMLDEQQRR
jgi:hypothetical protein